MMDRPTNREARSPVNVTPRSLPYLVRVGILLGLYLSTARLGLSMDAVNGFAAAVWPPTGISLVALSLFGSRLWPGIALGAFLVNASVAIGQGVPLLTAFGTACGMAVGNTLEALLGAYLLQRAVAFRPSLERLRDVLGLAVLAAALSTLVSATLGVTSGWLGGVISSASYGRAWGTWWLGDMVGDLVLAPLLFIWFGAPRLSLPPRRVAEAGTLLAAMATVSLLVFGGLYPTRFLDFPFVLFPFLIWAALRFGQHGAVTATFVVSMITIWGTAHGHGPFARATLNESLLSLQAFMSVMAVTILVLAAEVTERQRAEEALRQQAAALTTYARLIDLAHDAILVRDLESAILQWNQGAEEMYGWAREAAVGEISHSFLQTRFPKSREALDALLERDGRWEGELTHTRRDGTSLVVESRQVLMRDEQGTPTAILEIDRDITERNRVEQRLGAQHAVTRVLAEAATLAEAAPGMLEAVCNSVGWDMGALWEVDRDSSMLRCVDLWHRSSVEIPEFEAITRQHTFSPGVGLPGRVWASGEPAWIVDVVQDTNFPRAPFAAKEGLHAAFAFPVRRGNDILGVIEFFSREIRLPENDLLDMFAAIGSQIGQFIERKRDEAALRQGEARKGAILETALDSIITIDHEGRITEWNPAAEKTFGYSHAEALGKEMGTLIVPPSLREAHRRGLAHCLATGEGSVLDRRVEIAALRADGTEFPVELAITRIPSDGPPMFTGFVRDITERKRLESALRERAEQFARADRAKDQFLAMLAHELRNPLGAISNALHLLKKRASSDPSFGRPLEIIERQVHHQAHMLDDLLNVSRIARGKITLHPIRLDMVRLAQDVVEDHRHAFEEAGLTLELQGPAEPLWLMGDPTRLAQVLGNLLHNAQKFTDPGGRVTVQVDLTPLPPSLRGKGESGAFGGACSPFPRREGGRGVRSWAAVTVRDTGIGIEPALLSRLFESFIQAERSLDRSRGGLGLGLALVKGLVELHGGEVSAESEGPGRGASFTFRLPLACGPDAPAAAPAPTSAAARRCRILVVEDNRDAAETLRDLLELSGHEVAVAHTGPDGVAAARQFRPTVVLCDLGLPGMDGYGVASELRQDPATTGARLIAVSGYAQEKDQRRSRAAGFDRHLTKPVDAVELEQILAAVLASA